VKTKSLCGDGAYGSGKMRKDMAEKRVELISKAPVPKDTGKFTKEDFQIDLEEARVICPEGKVTEKYHQSKDTRIHKDIAKMIGGRFCGLIRTIKLTSTDRLLNIAHGSSAAWVYRTMIMDRDAMHMLEAVALGKIPFVNMIMRGHWHKFVHIHMESIHMLQLPGWQAFVPWKGSIRSYGKFQPDIGACILLIDEEDRMIVLPFTHKNIPHIGDAVWEG